MRYEVINYDSMGYERKSYTESFIKPEMLIFLSWLTSVGELAAMFLSNSGTTISVEEKSRGSFNIA